NPQGMFATGPNGESAVSASDVELTEEQYAAVKAMNLKAALLWAGAGEWYNAMTDGAKSEFEKMGIEVVATSDAQFDPAQQATQIETTMALAPDMILTLPVDPESGTAAYRPAVDAGAKIVFADNGVNGYVAGEDYVSIVTGDQYGMGRACAKLMSDAIGGSGKIGMIYYDADFTVTNNRDNEFIRTMLKDYPEIEIVAAQGFAEESATGEAAAAMLAQNPDLDGLYVSWDVAAEPVVAEVRSAGMTNLKLVTLDLGGNNDLDMAQNGNVYGKVADMPFQIGGTMAKLAALSILEEETPSYVVSEVVSMTRDNMVDAWKASLNRLPDQAVLDALK
ncbi:MAG: substrate-binding domain-containing protein, partial [Pygmaiobacter sp.]